MFQTLHQREPSPSMTTLLLGQDTFHWGYETHHKNQDHLLQRFPSTQWLQLPMPFQGQRQQSSERRIMTMCLILDRLPIAVRPTPVAHRRAALAPRQPWGPMRQQIWPPMRPMAVLQTAMAQPSQTAHQAPHRLQDGPVHHVLRKLCQPRFQADHLSLFTKF